MITRPKRLFTTAMFVFMATAPDAYACSDGEANFLFVKAATLVQEAKADDVNAVEKRDKLKSARHNLENIIHEFPCSRLAVRLSSGQSIGEISIDRLDRQIRMLKNELPNNCSSEKLIDALGKAIQWDRVRDVAIAAAARKLVRCGEFGCAQSIADIIRDDDKRDTLQQGIAMAQVRAATRRERCCSC